MNRYASSRVKRVLKIFFINNIVFEKADSIKLYNHFRLIVTVKVSINFHQIENEKNESKLNCCIEYNMESEEYSLKMEFYIYKL